MALVLKDMEELWPKFIHIFKKNQLYGVKRELKWLLKLMLL